MSDQGPYADLARALNAPREASRMGLIKFGKHDLEFWAGVSKIAALARARGHLGQDGNPIWSIDEWQAFCRGCRAYTHLPFFQAAIANTVHEVEACLADGYDAADIHAVLIGANFEKERHLRAAKQNAFFVDVE